MTISYMIFSIHNFPPICLMLHSKLAHLHFFPICLMFHSISYATALICTRNFLPNTFFNEFQINDLVNFVATHKVIYASVLMKHFFPTHETGRKYDPSSNDVSVWLRRK